MSIHIHEEVAKAALVRSDGADQVVQVCCERHAFARGGGNVHTVAGEVAVVAEIHASCCALVESVVCCRGSENDRCREGEECGCELHDGCLKNEF
jgi:hypothetical protein